MKRHVASIAVAPAYLLLLAGLSGCGGGSGGGGSVGGNGSDATVTLTASGTFDDVQLSWTVSGTITAAQVYRDTDSDPSGRTNVATLDVTKTSYTDSTAVMGTQYWYWIDYTTNGNHHDSSAATAVRKGVVRNLTSLQLAAQMSPGINLGNTLEAIPAETSWGAPLTTQTTMNGFKTAGFKSVRIPVAWSQYADANYDISPAWMARVTEVVNYARKAGLYAIINIHWDGGWMDHPTYDQQAAINAKLAKFWTQIANNFKYYDDYLLFAGTNEVGQTGTWQAPTTEYATVQNSFNQTFVDTVRATGGNNPQRHLVVQAYFTNIGYAVDFAVMPTDSTPNRLFMEVHYYDPYNFTLNGTSTIWQWGASATDPSAVETWANEAWADLQFQRMKTRFVDQGVAVILGEYGAYAKPQYPGMKTYCNAWVQYITRSMYQHGLVPMYWDTGGLMNRATGAQNEPDVISLIINATQ